jgi:hypothetical protein
MKDHLPNSLLFRGIGFSLIGKANLLKPLLLRGIGFSLIGKDTLLIKGDLGRSAFRADEIAIFQWFKVVLFLT